MADVGQATALYVRLVDQVLRLGDELAELTPAERSEAVFRMLRGLLLEAYASDKFALAFLESPLGDSLLRAVVQQAAWILARNGLLPSSGSERLLG
jgi:hypothetical protein